MSSQRCEVLTAYLHFPAVHQVHLWLHGVICFQHFLCIDWDHHHRTTPKDACPHGLDIVLLYTVQFCGEWFVKGWNAGVLGDMQLNICIYLLLVALVLHTANA